MFRLSEFSLYRPESQTIRTGWDKTTPDYEMEPLHILTNKRGVNELLFDGILSVGNERRYVQKAPFKILTVEGYGDHSIHSVTGKIWIQSNRSKNQGIWYELGEPSSEYRRFHEPFLWVADFTKLFVDYLLDHERVEIQNFRSHFYKWIRSQHRGAIGFQHWLTTYGRTDFTTVVAAHIGFLWKEATNVEPSLRRQPIWKQVDPEQLDAIKVQPRVEAKTIVTPFVYECFKNMYFAECLQPLSPDNKDVVAAQSHRKALFGFTNATRSFTSPNVTVAASDSNRYVAVIPSHVNKSHQQRKVKVGDIVSVSRDEVSVWKDIAATWYAYVQGVRTNCKEEKLLDVVWLYRPQDTTLSNMTYPVANELFFSDNCNCKDGVLKAEEVLSHVDVELFARDLDSVSNYIVRQKYFSDDHSFVTLRKSDLICQHKTATRKSDLEEVMEKYKIGDAVLAAQKTKSLKGRRTVLEPFIIRDFVLEQEQVVVQRLLRRSRDFDQADAPPNELVWTEQVLRVPAKFIERPCYVRFFSAADAIERRILPPYNRDGTADCFYIKTRLVAQNGRQELKDFTTTVPRFLRQGFDPTEPPSRPPLRGLDLFCGGGNFGRGLEEGGAVRFEWAVDFAKHAMHSYRANLTKPDEVRLFMGSIDDYLAGAIRGNSSPLIANVGGVGMIAAGSPCQGFSNMQRDKNSSESMRNASRVASVAAAIEHYLPEYALLENVVSMTSHIGPKKDENVFSQLLCAIVGMGYQVQQFNLDAWSFGSSQSRSRLFIAIAAPGLTPLPHPALTHSHPSNISDKCLGRAVNGERFGERRFEHTPFEFVTARDATRDLPRIGDSRVQTCIPFPDHRTSVNLNARARGLIAMIPTMPRRMNLAKTVLQDRRDQTHRMARPQLDYFYSQSELRTRPDSKQWGRVHPDRLLPTVLTRALPADGIQGTTLHWDERRLLTVMEVRRAQGFPDDEVIVGLPAHQWKIVGNSVVRPVALALGMSLRKAWFPNPPDGQERKVSATGAQEMGGRASGSHLEDAIGDVSVDMSLAEQASSLLVRSENVAVRENMHEHESEEIKITKSVSVKRSSVVHRTSTAEQTDDTLEIVSRTIYRKSTRLSLPLREKSGPKSQVVVDPSRSSDTLRPLKQSVTLRRHSDGVPVVVIPSRRTRSDGQAEVSPADWSKIPGARCRGRRARSSHNGSVEIFGSVDLGTGPQ